MARDDGRSAAPGTPPQPASLTAPPQAVEHLRPRSSTGQRGRWARVARRFGAAFSADLELDPQHRHVAFEAGQLPDALFLAEHQEARTVLLAGRADPTVRQRLQRRGELDLAGDAGLGRV